MSFRNQTGSRRSSGEKSQKPKRDKAKAKEHKNNKAAKKQLLEETPMPSLKEVEEKTVECLNRLGKQVFALSPFSQYFDDWLLNLKQSIFEFASNPNVKTDEIFAKDQSQIFRDVESSFAENRIQESNLSQVANAVAENNHLIVELDANYAKKTREFDDKRNLDIQIFSHKVHDLEIESEAMKIKATKGFNPFAKKSAAQKLVLINQNLTIAKNELEIVLENFKVEQEKLHDDYEKRKQEALAKTDSLRKELEKLETDNSLSARQTACNALITAIKALIERTQIKDNLSAD